MEVKKDICDDWRVVYTKSRNEKKVYEALLAQGFESYCPCQKVLKLWSDRKKWVEEPLFKSYVFVKTPATEKERIAILETAGVVRFLFWLGNPAQVRQSEIEAIQNFIGEYHEFEVASFEKGTALKVNDGVLKGVTGIVDHQSGKQVTLLIEKLGMSLVAKVSKHQVSKLLK